MSSRDLDQSGFGFQRVRTYLGPSLGWVDELVKPESHITTGGIYTILPGESVLLVDVAAAVQINLPDVRSWVGQRAGMPATALEKSLTIKDLGQNAANFNIVIAPFQGQMIDEVQQSIVISDAGGTAKLLPLIDMTGWLLETTGGGGGSGGGGDVFKAGNNTFTGTNTFQSTITAPQMPVNDDSQNVATTGWVNLHGFITSAALTPYALLASPTFTGDPKAPTPVPGDNDTSIATTAFVTAAVAAVGVGAPANAEYITGTTEPGLSNERVLTDSATITWDRTVSGQVKANTAAGGGNVSNSGTPTTGQYGKWVTATTIQGVAPATVLTDIGAQPVDADLTAIASQTYAADQVPYFTGPGAVAVMTVTAAARTVLDDTTVGAMLTTLGGQPLDGDLTAIAALAGTNTIYYRSATNIWSPVTFSGLTFSGGVLTASAGGNVSNSGTPTAGQLAVWTNATTIQGVTAAYAPLADPVFTGDPKAPTPATADNDTSIATTAFVKAQGYAPLASPPLTGTPTAPTVAKTDSSTTIATTAYVKSNLVDFLPVAGGSTLTGGFYLTPYNAGTLSSGTFTPNAGLGNYQYYTNSGAHTLAAPTADCAIDIMVTNGATAGAITFTGFTVAAGNTGDALTTTNTSKFIISIRRINAISTYLIKALQ